MLNPLEFWKDWEALKLKHGVLAVQVTTNGVNLQLDTGSTLSLANLLTITDAPALTGSTSSSGS